MRKRGAGALALVLALAALMCCMSALPASAAEKTESAEAASIQLMKTEGDVSVTNASGRSLSRRDNMRLYNGYHVKTEAKSYAWINLDSEKLAKLDAVSEAEVRKSGKQLELLLDSGSLFFNVTSPLKEEETLNIRTATMVVGIRGTSGWLRVVDRWSTEVCVLEGTVRCNVSDPVTGQTRTATVRSGEKAVATAYSQEQEGDACAIVQERLDPADIHGFVLEELAGDPELCAEISEASGLELQSALEGARERLEQDQKEMQDKLDSIGSQQAETNGGASPAGHASSSGGSGGGGTGGGTGGGGTGGGTGGGGTGSETGGGTGGETGGSGWENDPTALCLTMPQDAGDALRQLSEGEADKVVLLAGGGAADNTLRITAPALEIPAGKALILTEGVNAAIGEGAALMLCGTLSGEGSAAIAIADLGMLYIDASGALELRSVQNDGTFFNDGGRVVTNTLTTGGAFTSSGTIEGTVVHTGGITEIVGGGTIRNPASGAALAAQGSGTIGIFDGTVDGGRLPALLVASNDVQITVGDSSAGVNRAVLRSALAGAPVRFDVPAPGAGLEYVTAGGTVSAGAVLTVAPDGGGRRLAGAAGDLASALDGARDGEIVVLPWDLETAGDVTVSGSTVGLDLNGHTLTLGANGVIRVSGALALYDSGAAGAVRSGNKDILVDAAGKPWLPAGFAVTGPDGGGLYSLAGE